MAAPKEPRIVAELGRPETPEETAARKAENSLNHRKNQTLRNLIYSLIATLVVVLVLVAVVVRPDPEVARSVDFHQIAAESQVNASVPLTDPALSDEWTANDASLTTSSDQISTWYIGLITPKEQFIAIKQGIGANPTWVSQQLEEVTPTGTTVVDGVTWDVYDHRNSENPGNLAYAMVTTVPEPVEGAADGTGSSTYVLYGTAVTDEFEELATAITEGEK